MALSEFSLINQQFKHLGPTRNDVLFGIGDDAAILQVPPSQVLLVTTDSLVADVHFQTEHHAADIAYKALMVNLSDLAAMGAEPAWASLALTLPRIEQSWLTDFCRGLAQGLEEFGVQLIGGDTCCGPLNICLTLQGFAPAAQVLKRNGARPGDAIYVSGTLGDAALALRFPHAATVLNRRLLRPTPRVALGLALRDIASAAIDLSDGLLADLNHILQASKVGAVIDDNALPLSAAYQQHINLYMGDPYDLALSGGDDYELCFTVPPTHTQRIPFLAKQLGLDLSCIGYIDEQRGLRRQTKHGTMTTCSATGYQHFR